MNLKWHLVRRIAVVAIACFLAGAAYAVYRAAGEAHAQNATLADSAGRQLELQLFRIDSALDVKERFPDWDAIVSYGLAPGQCVQYLGDTGTVIKSNCAGADSKIVAAPGWFAWLYKSVLCENTNAMRAISFKGKSQGRVVASSQASTVAARAWEAISPLLGLTAALMTLLCLVVYWVIDRALQPTKDILAGLNQLAAGDLAVRLPPFQLEELNRISEVFNGLTGKLQETTLERLNLARRLVDSQERERRHIARELHDDVAQRVSAIGALSASISASAGAASPQIASEANDLAKQSVDLMQSIRQTLTYLRPQELDDLGLIASLKSLTAEHNARAKGATGFTLETLGNFDGLSSETNAHVYRIIQEGLNNAAKHANAKTVAVTLKHVEAVAGRGTIVLDVSDDGRAIASLGRGPGVGMGLTGMRERVLALNGSLTAGPASGGGFNLHVEFPFSALSKAAE
jgi:two-component system, NarL family, sensor histidine kinase UhpB